MGEKLEHEIFGSLQRGALLHFKGQFDFYKTETIDVKDHKKQKVTSHVLVFFSAEVMVRPDSDAFVYQVLIPGFTQSERTTVSEPYIPAWEPKNKEPSEDENEKKEK